MPSQRLSVSPDHPVAKASNQLIDVVNDLQLPPHQALDALLNAYLTAVVHFDVQKQCGKYLRDVGADLIAGTYPAEQPAGLAH